MSRLWFGSALIALTACGAPPALPRTTDGMQATGPTSGAQPAAAAAAAPTIVPRVLPAIAQQTRVRAVAFEQLSGMLPSVDGWTRTDAKSEQLFKPAITARAEALYRQADSHVELEIADSAGDQLLLAPISIFLATGYYERLGDGIRHASRIAGYPAFEEWHPASRRGEITVLVADRVIVRAAGHDVDSLAPVKDVIGAVDFPVLARLK